MESEMANLEPSQEVMCLKDGKSYENQLYHKKLVDIKQTLVIPNPVILNNPDIFVMQAVAYHDLLRKQNTSK